MLQKRAMPMRNGDISLPVTLLVTLKEQSSLRKVKILTGSFMRSFMLAASVAQARNMTIGAVAYHSKYKDLYGRKNNCFCSLRIADFNLNPFTFVGYRNNCFFYHTNPYILNVMQQLRWSYFELGPPVVYQQLMRCVVLRF